MSRSKNFINGSWVDGSLGVLSMINPSHDTVIGQIARSGPKDIDAAVNAARAAYEGTWGNTPPHERGRILHRISQILFEHAEELALIESADCGKPLKQARSDAQMVARYFEFYAGAADKFHGETIPYQNGYTVYTWREPFGVTGHIIPWNYPLQMTGRTLAPALATGNATILKPAEEACLSIVRLFELIESAGLPPGAINLVTGRGDEAGAALANHSEIDHLAFTGSPEVGTIVMQSMAKNRRPVVLELGGKSPQIVFEDADMDAVLPVIVNAIIQNAGQTCSAGSRLVIHESIYDSFIERLAERFIAQNEVFGPVLAVIPFKDEDEALSIANGTLYGLVAGVWTRDISRAHRMAKKIKAGQIFINSYGAGGGVELPFGGVKESGFGREKGFEALYHVTTTKTIVISHG